MDPQEACSLQQIIYESPAFGQPKLMKIDLSDGYYHSPLSTSGILQLGAILSSLVPEEEPLITFPFMLPMGWGKSANPPILLHLHQDCSQCEQCPAPSPGHACQIPNAGYGYDAPQSAITTHNLKCREPPHTLGIHGQLHR